MADPAADRRGPPLPRLAEPLRERRVRAACSPTATSAAPASRSSLCGAAGADAARAGAARPRRPARRWCRRRWPTRGRDLEITFHPGAARGRATTGSRRRCSRSPTPSRAGSRRAPAGLAHDADGSSTATSAGQAGDEGRPGLPVLLRRARRGAEPRPGPGRGAASARPRRRGARAGRATADAARPTSRTPGAPSPVPYNGSVARVSLRPGGRGPGAALAARGALRRRAPARAGHARASRCSPSGRADVPGRRAPSTPPTHRSLAMSASAAILRPALEKIDAHIAVSEDARGTLRRYHAGGEPVVIPNGVDVDHYAQASPRAEWRGTAGTVAFVGRVDEPRKGFALLLRGAAPASPPTTRASGCSSSAEVTSPGARRRCPSGCATGSSSSARRRRRTKAAAARARRRRTSPPTPAARASASCSSRRWPPVRTVLASDLPAFARVLDDGRLRRAVPLRGRGDLAAAAGRLLDDPVRRTALDAAAAVGVRRYDWARGGPS